MGIKITKMGLKFKILNFVMLEDLFLWESHFRDVQFMVAKVTLFVSPGAPPHEPKK